MDTWGFVLIIVAILGYFLIRKTHARYIPLVAFVGGLGVGIVFTSWYTVFVFMGGL